MKKSLSLALSLIMIITTLCALPFTAFATSTFGNVGSDVTYELTSNGYLYLRTTGASEDYISTADYGANDSPFYGKTNIRAVYIEENIDRIGEGVFFNCTGLEIIGLSHATDLDEIGEYAFSGCTSLEKVSYSDKDGGSIRTIGEYAFEGCTSLKQFIVPEDVKKIEKGTFKNCSSLRIVSLRSSTNTIADDVFSGCDALRDVCYGSTLSNFNNISTGKNNSAFSNATPHTECIGGVIGENAIYTVDWSYNMVISGTGATYDYKEADPGTPLNSLPWSFYYVTIEEGITRVGDFLFNNCDDIDKVTFPRSVTSIGDSAFYDCDDIDEVYYPGTQAQLVAITSGGTIGYNKWLFSYNNGYEDVNVDFHQAYNYQGKCGDRLRYDYDQYTNTLTILGSGAMWDFDYNNTIKGSTAPWSNYYDSITNLVINSGVTSIGEFSFMSTRITSVTTPSTMKKIGEYAFAYCTKLNNITINGKNCVIESDAFTDGSPTVDAITLNGVKSVGTNAFYDVYSNTISLGNIETIGYGAFACNEHVTSVEIPATCTYVDCAAFSSCKKLEDIYFYNPDCYIDDEPSTVYTTATIHGYFGSTAQDYAISNNRNFVTMPCKDGKHSTVDEGKIVATTATTYTKQYFCERCGATFTKKYNKAANTLTVKGKTKTVALKTVKKKNVTVKRADAVTVSKNKGKVTYAKASGNAKITINKTNGNITVKKGLKKGTYKVKVKVTAAGTNTFKKGTKTVTVTIKVK